MAGWNNRAKSKNGRIAASGDDPALADFREDLFRELRTYVLGPVSHPANTPARIPHFCVSSECSIDIVMAWLHRVRFT